MTKSKKYNAIVTPLLEENDFKGLTNYILDNSNLPGRMANLPLISTIADSFELNNTRQNSWYDTLENWFDTNVDGNSSETLLVLTALESFGSLYHNSAEKERSEIKRKLRSSLNDDRWRVREIVTESYKRIGLTSYDSLISLFREVLADMPTPSEIRGILATVAHPELLITTEQLAFSLEILQDSFNYYLRFDNHKFSKEEKLILKKGLSFAPSVIVSKNPTSGFSFFENVIGKDNKEINVIVKENLKKKRLENFYPNEVKTLLALIVK